MKAMILAAGRGERLRPITDSLPKPMLEVRGKPLIAWHVERLASAGFREIVINVSHLGKLIESFIGDGSRWGLAVSWSHEDAPLETAGGIAQARMLLGVPPFARFRWGVRSSGVRIPSTLADRLEDLWEERTATAVKVGRAD